MPRFRRMAPIDSVKHIIDSQGTLVDLGTKVEIPIATAVSVRSDPFNPSEVTFGRTINAFFLSVFILGATGAGIGPGNINWYLIKIHSGQASSTPDAQSVGVSELRNQIIHQEKGLSGSQDGTPMAFKGVIVVPKGMRRMREGDEWRVVLNLTAAATADAVFCLRSIHKSFG